MKDSDANLSSTVSTPTRDQESVERDGQRLSFLEDVLKNCPHAELTYNDDPDEGPVGWSLVIEGCTRLDIKAPTLLELLDLGMTAEPDEDGNVIRPMKDSDSAMQEGK